MRKYKIKFGVNIIFDKEIYSAIDFASENGFSSIELWPVAPQFLIENYSKKERTKIAKYAEKKKVQIQLHAPEDLNLFSTPQKIRKANLDYYKDLIDFGKDIKATTLTIHPGKTTVFTFPSMKIVPLFCSYPEYFLPFFKKNLEVLCNYAKNKVKLCIENADYFEEPLMKVISDILSKKKLFLTWDIAKSYNKDGTIKQREIDFFLKNIKYIKNIHLHDATSAPGHHEIIGKGFVDFKFFFEKLKNLDVNYIIEVRPHSNAIKSRANLLKILGHNYS